MTTDAPGIDAPPLIAAADLFRLHRIEWTIGADDLISIVDIAAMYGVTRATFDSMLVRRAKYRRLDGFPTPVVKGVYSRALVHLHLDPSWRPAPGGEAGTSGAIWRDLGLIVYPVAEDVTTLADLAPRLGISRSALRAALSDGQKTPKRIASMPNELVPAAKVMVWSAREIDAWFARYEGADLDPPAPRSKSVGTHFAGGIASTRS